MKNNRPLLLLVMITAVVAAAWPAAAFAATDPGLGTAGNFAVLSGTPNITNTGPTWITGQVGIYPGTAITGFPPGVSGPQHIADGVATVAKTDLTAAYTNAAAQPCPPGVYPAGNDLTGQNLGGKTLGPGVYCQTTAPTLTGTLTLSGAGIYIFQIGSTLVTANGAVVSLTGGADPCNIFWQVGSSATIAPTTTMIGNIMALTSIGMQTGASLTGRALARNGAVTLDTNRIIQPSGCTYAANPTVVAAPGAVAATPTPAATATPASRVGLPNTGGPPQQPGFPWLPLAIAGAIGATLFGLRRRTHKRGS